MEINNRYPLNITDAAYETRSIKLFVKNNEVFSNVGKLFDAVSKGDTLQTSQAVLQVHEDVKGTFKGFSSKNSNQSTVWCCALPLPDQLEDSQTHNWSSSNGMVSEIASEKLRDLSSTIGKGFLGNSFDIAKGARELAARMGTRQPIINPGYYQDYTGSDLRTFNFSWTFIPNNAIEAKEVVTIIKNLKRFSSPTHHNVALLSPYTFDIFIGNPVIDDLMRMQDLVITSLGVTYAEAGGLQFLPDGSPKVTNLKISFAERRLLTAEEYS